MFKNNLEYMQILEKLLAIGVLFRYVSHSSHTGNSEASFKIDFKMRNRKYLFGSG